MRTTVTLDDDLAVRLERRRADHALSFKQVLNQTVREGLASLEQERNDAPAAAARTAPLTLGRRLVADVDDVADALALAEAEDYR